MTAEEALELLLELQDPEKPGVCLDKETAQEIGIQAITRLPWESQGVESRRF